MDNWNQNQNSGNEMWQQTNEFQNGMYNGMYNGQYNVQQDMYGMQENMISVRQKRNRLLNPSAILGLLSSVLLLIGLLAPMIDFSHFEHNVDIQYNLVKICKNVGLISAPWTGIPYGIVIGILAMLVLSFVRIPLLKLIPCMIVLSMFIIMLADMGNVIDWVEAVLDKYYGENLIIVNTSEVMKSLMAGVYILVSGLLVGFISCFVKGKEQ